MRPQLWIRRSFDPGVRVVDPGSATNTSCASNRHRMCYIIILARDLHFSHVHCDHSAASLDFAAIPSEWSRALSSQYWFRSGLRCPGHTTCTPSGSLSLEPPHSPDYFMCLGQWLSPCQLLLKCLSCLIATSGADQVEFRTPYALGVGFPIPFSPLAACDRYRSSPKHGSYRYYTTHFLLCRCTTSTT